ncbi:aspartate--tRNA(Asn) ligase [Candidatus Micrarchaeota archaeon]|nr:aspartate--tRNA(Asn) ligase [Candidatus Micrarchaeota archaeon]
MYRTHYIKDAKGKNGEKVKIAGWIHDFRDKGGIKFIVVRDISGTIQVTAKKGVIDDQLFESIKANKEDVVCFSGTMKENERSKGQFEIIPDGFSLLNKVEMKLPVDPTGLVPSELEVRLDNRYIDLRRKETSLIFKVKAIAAAAFREKLSQRGFLEIHPSAISGAATEGGADVFELGYFEKKAYLVQSPQLYKQMAVIGGFDRAMMIVPVFRAEKHNTTQHLNEITQMDVEMGFVDHTHAMDMLEEVFLHMLNAVKERFGEEIKTVFGREVLVPSAINRHSYDSLVEKLNQSGFAMEKGEDFSKEAEKKLFEILGEEVFFIEKWPTKVRAFYSMPDPQNPERCNAFDLMYRGLEISSGAQRIHIPALLEEQLRSRGIDPKNFEFYINAFRSGAPPHAGWSIGLERLTMKLCNQDNIREAMLFPRDRTRLLP